MWWGFFQTSLIITEGSGDSNHCETWQRHIKISTNIRDSAFTALFSAIISLFMINQRFYAVRNPILCGDSVALGVGSVVCVGRVILAGHYFVMTQFKELLSTSASDYLLMHAHPELLTREESVSLGIMHIPLVSLAQHASQLSTVTSESLLPFLLNLRVKCPMQCPLYSHTWLLTQSLWNWGGTSPWRLLSTWGSQWT